MKPLAQLPRELAASLRGVIFDVDDTLTTRGRLTAEAYGALTALHDAGLSLIAVTGRPLGWTDAFAASWPIDLALGENGAGWAHSRGGAIAVGYFHDEATRRQQAARLASLVQHVEAEHPELRPASDQPARRCDHAWDVGERDDVGDDAVDALRQTIEREGARCLVSSVHAHALVGDWDKARGVVRAADQVLGADVGTEPWLFVGDSGNDAAAFAFFSHTVGVANVRAHLDRIDSPPAYVTEAERGAGFVELSQALLAARGSTHG